jgi:hypothetical protein
MNKIRPISASSSVARVLAGRQAAKIFAIGFNKTGTTSLHEIFSALGYRSYHGTKWRDTSKPLIYRFYDAFCDGDPDDFRRLDAMFPKVHFILQVRDLDAWLDSRIEHIRRLPSSRDRGGTWTDDPESVAAWVRKHDAYHLDVLKHFRGRPDRLLLVNYIRDPQAAAKIARFLGHDGAEKAHANRNPGAGRSLKNAAMIAEVLIGMGIPEAEWQNVIFCPGHSGAQPGIPADTSEIRV